MLRSTLRAAGLTVGFLLAFALHPAAREEDGRPGATLDFGALVQEKLKNFAPLLFGMAKPLDESAKGPFDGPSSEALELAKGLKATVVSTAVHFSADQIALWPDDDHPRYLFVCDEEASVPAVQRVDLQQPVGTNATTIVTGLAACDPVRRTPWGTIIVAEEAGATGGFYEIVDPAAITTPIAVTDRATGASTDPAHLVKRQAVGSLSFESVAIAADGTMLFGDELAPGGGAAGGGIYKFVPTNPYSGGGPITAPALSPLASGLVYGLRVAAAGSSNWGQAAETGKGLWVQVNLAGAGVVDGAGNIILRTAQVLQRFTGYYRPEDMDIDPSAAGKGVMRACWANTGRASHAGDSVVENSAVRAEIMCLTEEAPSAALPTPATGTIPHVERFVPGSQEAAMFDNVAFQPHTGNLVVLEDGPTGIVRPDGSVERRGNDLWICLPDGADDDVQTDGCVRFGSLRDTSAEPTGFIFVGSGEAAFVSLQHRAVDEAGGRGSLLLITGFGVHGRE
jgi:secreted PhoX family phosphatase